MKPPCGADAPPPKTKSPEETHLGNITAMIDGLMINIEERKAQLQVLEKTRDRELQLQKFEEGKDDSQSIN